MSLAKLEATPIVILSLVIVIVFINITNCDKPDICLGSSVTAIERIEFLDHTERYFVSSGRYYWFINQTADLPSVDSATELPYGFVADAALIKDTRHCHNGNYALLLIQKKRIRGTNEQEWLTMEYRIKDWGENGTNSGEWSEPVKIAHCLVETKVCTITDKYFTEMNFDFKRSLDAAFGTIGGNAYFVQGTLIYNVTYRNRCVYNSYTDVISSIGFVPLQIKTILTAAYIKDTSIVLFDNEYYTEIRDGLRISDKEISNWAQSPNNFFKACPPLVHTFARIFRSIFYDHQTRSVSTTAVSLVVFVFLLSLVIIAAIIIWINIKRKSMRISEEEEERSDSPQHDHHLLSHDTPKQLNGGKQTNQVRIPLQTSC